MRHVIFSLYSHFSIKATRKAFSIWLPNFANNSVGFLCSYFLNDSYAKSIERASTLTILVPEYQTRFKLLYQKLREREMVFALNVCSLNSCHSKSVMKAPCAHIMRVTATLKFNSYELSNLSQRFPFLAYLSIRRKGHCLKSKMLLVRV